MLCTIRENLINLQPSKLNTKNKVNNMVELLEKKEVITPMSKKQLCKMYGVSYPTLAAWFKMFPPEVKAQLNYVGKTYTIKQVKLIRQQLE